MALGVKIKKTKLNKKYTLEELFAAMQQKTDWTGGTPALVKHGFSPVIVFPPIDRQNQVWVQVMNVKGSDTVQVWASHDIAGDFGNMAKNMILDQITGGLTSMGSMFGKNAKKVETTVDATVQELNSLNL